MSFFCLVVDESTHHVWKETWNKKVITKNTGDYKYLPGHITLICLPFTQHHRFPSTKLPSFALYIVKIGIHISRGWREDHDRIKARFMSRQQKKFRNPFLINLLPFHSFTDSLLGQVQVIFPRHLC